MRFMLLLPPLLGCGPSTAVTTDPDGNVTTVAEADFAALAQTVATLQTELADTQTELADTQAELASTQAELASTQAELEALGQQVDELKGSGSSGGSGEGVSYEDLEALEYAVASLLDALEARVDGLDLGLAALDADLATLGADVDALIAGSGNELWTASASSLSTSITHGSTWATATSTTISLERTDPLLVWCQFHENYTSSSEPSILSVRATLKSDDGTLLDATSEADLDVFQGQVMTTFEVDEAGDYTLACETKDMTTLGLASMELFAVQVAPVVSSSSL